VEGISFAAAKWGLASLLILPQSILLGATFPVFASATTRGAPSAEGRSIAMLYFANSIGGAIGVLMSGFVLIPTVGLPGTIGVAGVVNLALAALVLYMSRAAVPRSAAKIAAHSATTRAGDAARFEGMETLLIA